MLPNTIACTFTAVPQEAGMTDEQGQYKLIYLRDIEGALVGKHRVRIGSDERSAPPKQRLPSRYNHQTTLEAEVTGGQNEFNFTLTKS